MFIKLNEAAAHADEILNCISEVRPASPRRQLQSAVLCETADRLANSRHIETRGKLDMAHGQRAGTLALEALRQGRATRCLFITEHTVNDMHVHLSILSCSKIKKKSKNHSFLLAQYSLEDL